MKYKRTTLPNGLRIITVPTKGNPSVTVMVAVEAGSNYETKSQNGISHFLEHMCFKGTTKRPTQHEIAVEFDSIGAGHNAWTSSEITAYYAKAEKKHFDKLLDVVSDMYLDPKLASEDIETERAVILQEISMNGDKPQRQVWYELIKLLYGDTPAGRRTIGTPETVKSFSRNDLINYRKKHYVAEGTIVVVSGDIDERLVIKKVQNAFKNISVVKKQGKEKVIDKQKSPNIRLKTKSTDQTHMIIGFRAFDLKNKRNESVEILATVLGGGMSSRLFQRVREKMGACYSVSAHSMASTDHGSFLIPTGIDKSRAAEVAQAILEECNKLKTELISEVELEKAKEYFLGHLYMSVETSDGLAHFFAEEEVTAGKARQIDEIEKSIRAVTAEQVRNVAREIFQNKNLNLAVVGDIKDGKKLKKVLSLGK
jgi:predicted Zn-dependent peptidase